MSGAARDTNGGLHVVNVSAGYGFKPMHVSLGLAREVIFDLICGSECDHSAHELARELARDTAPKKIRPSNEMCVICVLLHNILLHKIFIEHVE